MKGIAELVWENKVVVVIEKLFIDAGSHRLEALYSRPEEPHRGVFVLCHPYPAFGGNMYHKVLVKLAETFLEEGQAVLRFNFKETGNATGEEVDPIGARHDLAQAVQWVRSFNPGRTVRVAGYSYGAFVGLSALRPKLAGSFQDGATVDGVMAIAYPANMPEYRLDFLPDVKLGFIHGTEDALVPVSALKNYLRSQRTDIGVHWVEGANHFFDGKLEALQSAARDCLVSL